MARAGRVVRRAGRKRRGSARVDTGTRQATTSAPGPTSGGQTELLAREGTEAALERYTEVFEFAPIGYATLTPDGVIAELNHSGAQLLGSERGRLVGKRFVTSIEPSFRPMFETFIGDAVAGRPARCEVNLLREDARIAVRLSAGMLRKSANMVMLAFEDISERKAKEQALTQTEQALREANRRKDEFLGMLSHELRNPLAPIRASISVLRLLPEGAPAAKNALDILDRNTSHLTRLVDELLDVTRIARGKIELRREMVELVPLLRRVLGDHAAALEKRQLQVTTHFDPDEPQVYGDPARLVQVFSNILGNAEKFTPAGGRIEVTLEATAKRALVRVRDSGVGLEPEMLDHVFEPFAQAPQALDRGLGGLGLGLALVKSIVEMHGGWVAINSPGLGRGTEVSVSLPVEESRKRTAVEQPPAQAATSGRRVLVVEDHADSAEALRYALTLKGHSVEIAPDGHTAVALARQFTPDVVLCDIGLPDMDGYAVARALRDEHCTARLVALSGYARPDDISRALAAGFDRHIAKPLRLEQLDRVLADLTP